MWLKLFVPYIFLINATDLLFKYAGHLDLHPLYFTMQAMVFGSLALLVLARPGPLALDTVRAKGTWVYAVLFLAGNVALFYTLKYVDIVTAGFLKTSSLLFSIVLAAVFLNRFSMNMKKAMGIVAIIGGLVALIDGMEAHLFVPALAICLGAGMITTLSAFTQELHEASNKTNGNIREELRVTGFTVGITALVFLLVILAATALKLELNVPVPDVLTPTAAQMLSVKSMLLALVYGVFLLSSLRFLLFYWIKRIKTETYLVLAAMLPFGAIVADYLGDKLGLVPMVGLTPIQIVAGVAIVAGALLVQFSGAKPRSLKKHQVHPGGEPL